jgi:glycosyltransferase involved in cell wall biosynthesis
MIVGLFTDLISIGGVQMAGRELAAALESIAAGYGYQTRFLSLNDPAGIHQMDFAGRSFQFTAFGGSKLGYLTECLRRTDPILILAAHPHLALPAQLVAKSARSKNRPPVVVCSHGVEVWRPLSLLRKAGMSRADLFFAPSTDTARRLHDVQDLPKERINVLPWCLDPEFLAQSIADAPPRISKLPKQPYILSVGRWAQAERYKGFDALIEAMPELAKAEGDVQLVLVGEGDDLAMLEQLARGCGVRDRVHFISGLSRAELFSAYLNCEIFALPSAGEGFGLVFLEAMACKKPVIGGDHGGTPDIIVDGVSGFLVEYGDKGVLMARLKELLQNKELRERMGNAGRERVEREFNFATFSCNLETALLQEFGSKFAKQN